MVFFDSNVNQVQAQDQQQVVLTFPEGDQIKNIQQEESSICDEDATITSCLSIESSSSTLWPCLSVISKANAPFPNAHNRQQFPNPINDK